MLNNIHSITISTCNAVLEKFDKWTIKCIDRRKREQCKLTLNANSSKNELSIELKTSMYMDMWISRNAKIFDDEVNQGNLSISLPEYHLVILVSNGITKELERFSDLAKKTINNKTLNLPPPPKPARPIQMLHPPLPDPPPLPKRAQWNSPLKPSPQKPSRSHHAPASIVSIPRSPDPSSAITGYTPSKKKSRPAGGTPQKAAMNSHSSPQSKPHTNGAISSRGNIDASPKPRKPQSTQPTLNFTTSPAKRSLTCPVPPSTLTSTQQATISACITGMNVFITGGAGTGKSSLISLIVGKMRKQHGSDGVFVTATTGLAACAIGGCTLHQFAGIGGYVEGADNEPIILNTLKNCRAIKRWRACQVLIVDEVSMLSAGLIGLVDYTGQRCRGNSKAFGGVQVILCGDFFQLPPVVRLGVDGGGKTAITTTTSTSTSTSTASIAGSTTSHFAFQSPTWSRLSPRPFILDRVFRQTDTSFVALLNDVRWGRLSPQGLLVLNACQGKTRDAYSTILPTQIFTHKHNVDQLNARELLVLPGDVHEFHAIDTGDKTQTQFLDMHCQAKTLIRLKVGAQVMLIKTIDATAGLVNGARGVVVRFSDKGNRPVVRFDALRDSASYSHTGTGGTGTRGTDAGRDRDLACYERTIAPEQFITQLGGNVQAIRMQLPLDLGWGLSVHKSQGMSVDQADLHLQGVFEYGQAYVALSRVRNMRGLKLVQPLQMSHIRAHPDVVAFYESLKK